MKYFCCLLIIAAIIFFSNRYTIKIKKQTCPATALPCSTNTGLNNSTSEHTASPAVDNVLEVVRHAVQIQ